MCWFRTDVPGSGVWTLYQYDGGTKIALGTLDTINHKWTPAAMPSLTADVFLGTGASGINVQAGTSYLLQPSDNGKTIYMTNAGANTVTAQSGLGDGFSCLIAQDGAGQTTIVQGTGATLRAPNGLKLAKQYSVAMLNWRTTNTWYVGGDVAP
jgi:hypothetical protein